MTTYPKSLVKELVYKFIREKGAGDLVYYTKRELGVAIDDFVEKDFEKRFPYIFKKE